MGLNPSGRFAEDHGLKHGKGHKIKLHLWKTEVKYLGCAISQQGRPLDTERNKAIPVAPKLVTKDTMMQFFGSWLISAGGGYPIMQKRRLCDKPMAAEDKYAGMFWLQAVVLASLALQSSASIVFC